jgi:hypothetical protein
MNINDIKWSASEKKIARAAFDKAYQREMEEIKNDIYEKTAALKNEKDIWELHNYLSDRREEIDKKYDYRYSQLILVFSRLLSENYLLEEDLNDLSEDKLKLIKKLSSRQ